MGKKDPRIDTYITKSAPFAQPILKRLRKLIHAGCPAVEESLKWNCPHFTHHGMLCGMAAFKEHCTFGFWKSRITEAKTDATRQKRLATALEWLAEGKSRNWKYEKC